ncbi:MAG TPA: HD domain-containing phosphohydrolase [Burkholderiaceae bacterium]|jgi:HD-GYP domain-containing protein (c-di-GMP phosphodiesterase class II)
MNLIAIDPKEIHIGQPLKWDIFDARGGLLVKKGNVIDTLSQLNKMLEAGIFFDIKDASPKTASKERVIVQEQPSVILQLINAGRHIGPLMYSLHLQSDASNKIIAISNDIIQAVRINKDIALASIFLNRAITDYAIRHSLNVAVMCILVAQAMKKSDDEIALLVAAALTMNLGMLRQQNEYHQRSAPLTEKERAAIRQHPQESVKMLQQAGVTNPEWLSYVLDHHECEDGSGYPAGKTAANIPQNAQILALSDMFCDRVTGRADRKPLPSNNALRSMFAGDQKRGSKNLAPYFIGAIGLYPAGTAVKLKSGEHAIVTKNGDTQQTPIVHACIGQFGAPLAMPIARDTSHERFAILQALSIEDAPQCFSMQRLWGNEAAG